MEIAEVKLELSSQNKREKEKLDELLRTMEKRSREMEEKEAYFRSANDNVEAQMLSVREKEQYLNSEKEKISTLQHKLKLLEKEMSEENQNFKMS